MSKSSFSLEILSPQGTVFKDEVDSVSLPTYSGRITILPNHAPLFTKLSEGEIEIKKESKISHIVVAGGFLEIKENSAHILSDYAVRAESIEIARAEERKREAELKLKQKLDNKEFTIADKDLRLSILELKVAQRVKKRTRVE
ncbi:MAG: ATP synthase F1 subunit epsilon [Candidatus Levybacteria bacterium RIFCSPHIGHO2_02_FULL_39_36]|nr:MAG: ATP synthase epsilon chain [Candidatus Levybacteria bacterium GW2011_GWA1_39_11]KKR25198.1 MAG: ATP synthase epsilon chain [Candidatus Levybacteria bacterium GW2011_GWB1_39_7]KKR25755.1 MAG: ATP synthase epsilon chain [Microgenomates group bacterium GW2011_GWC1_39_7]KKR49624.1 MAG: ATP synthase epsilon chain [Candidatus Levybacteria bacterium GW2011_GWA2_40_16]OGH15519.1 MAG: ATP synthase F1 subunit epsilon [Candidatus Levybacteria bacterium RIFCSPHIGHO2_01_FULL_38_96]OGH25392.1 MAG: A